MADNPYTDLDNDPGVRDDIAYLRRAVAHLDAHRSPDFYRQRAERIVAETRAELAARQKIKRRRALMVIGGTAAAAAAGIVGILGADQRQPRSAHAATPRALTITIPSASSGERDRRLDDLAPIAERAGTPRPSAPVEHVVIETWDLSTATDQRTVASAIVASQYQLWRDGDGRARLEERYLPPEFPTPAHRQAWQASGNTVDTKIRREDFTPSFAGRPPRDPDQLAGWLRRTDTADTAVLTGALDLLRERVLTGPERAALLRVLARHTALSYAGTTTDRAGRSGLAFTTTSSDSGAQEEHVLVIAARDAAVLAYERILISGADRLDVHRPAVISYRTYRTARFVATFP